MSELVEIDELVEREDGTVGIGGRFLKTKAEARLMILNEQAKAVGAARGVVPDDWKNSAVADVGVTNADDLNE